MYKINVLKTQRRAPRRADTISLSTRENAEYPIRVCICVYMSEKTVNIEKLSKLLSYFKGGFVVFVGNLAESPKMDNSVFLYFNGDSEATARNIYLSFVVNNGSHFDAMIVIDTKTSLINDIQSSSLSCCGLKRYLSWDAVFANQSYKYYDIANARPTTLNIFRNISRTEPPIPVTSAFGGLAIYKVEFLNEKMYSGDGHVVFNTNYYKNGGKRMFIDPSLILDTPPENAYVYIK